MTKLGKPGSLHLCRKLERTGRRIIWVVRVTPDARRERVAGPFETDVAARKELARRVRLESCEAT